MHRVVVADTSPLRYLVQIDQIVLLPRLFDKITIPSVVYDELRHPSAPTSVQDWIRAPPDWLEVSAVIPSDDPALQGLDKGEKAALTLGIALAADLILIDDRKGVAVARQKGFEILGTLGILALAARRGMVDLAVTIERLRATNFRRSEALLDALLKQYRQ